MPYATHNKKVFTCFTKSQNEAHVAPSGVVNYGRRGFLRAFA